MTTASIRTLSTELDQIITHFEQLRNKCSTVQGIDATTSRILEFKQIKHALEKHNPTGQILEDCIRDVQEIKRKLEIKMILMKNERIQA
jgi:cell fate (sporulation/competence/biofilm development) regulator YlbF (YheA/YmcA/DUF963 family)